MNSSWGRKAKETQDVLDVTDPQDANLNELIVGKKKDEKDATETQDELVKDTILEMVGDEIDKTEMQDALLRNLIVENERTASKEEIAESNKDGLSRKSKESEILQYSNFPTEIEENAIENTLEKTLEINPEGNTLV